VAQTAGIVPYVVLRSHGFKSHTEHVDRVRVVPAVILGKRAHLYTSPPLRW
jgi:hypothetical protein